MKVTTMHWIGISGLVLAGGCSLGGDAERISVESNALGVETIETTQFADNGNEVFELRGFSSHEEQLALIRLSKGEFAEIGAWLPKAGDAGSEITVSIGSYAERMLTPELEHFMLAGVDDPAAQQFLEVAAVSSRLASANIFFDHQSAGADAEIALEAVSCSPSYMLTTPPAKQCCFGQSMMGQIRSHHVNPNGNIGTRVYNASNYGAGCKDLYGSGSCSGASCYFGPGGFAKPIQYVPGAGQNFQVYTSRFNSQDACFYSTTPGTPTPFFPTVTGTQQTGQGCPGGNTGAYSWDY